MEISVSTQNLSTHEKKFFSGKTVIILDVFRATSFIVTAMALGAKSILPTMTIEEAKKRYNKGRILAGERSAKHIPGFHLGNSPAMLTDWPLRGKEMILTTTNGTKAIAKAKPAAHRLIGSFLNLSACSREAVQHGKPILLFCAGTQGEFSLEDGVAAGAFIDTCIKMQPAYRADDLGMMARQSYLAWRSMGWNQLKMSRSGQRIRRLGAEQDLDYCLQIDRFSVVPTVTKDEVIQID